MSVPSSLLITSSGQALIKWPQGKTQLSLSAMDSCCML